jgi:hypothetical protein
MRSLVGSLLLVVAMNLLSVSLPQAIDSAESRVAIGGIPVFRPTSYRCQNGQACVACEPYESCGAHRSGCGRRTGNNLPMHRRC